jgi:hypothetical protein
MAGKTNQIATLFAQKKLLGKANTSALKADSQETIGSNIQVASQTIFGQTIPTSPARTLYLLQSASAGADATVEYIQFDLAAIAGTTYDANVGTFGSTGFGGGDEAQSSGPHSYKLALSASYQASSSNGKAGAGTYDNSKVLYTTIGALQIVPPNFSNDSPNPYIMKLYSGDPSDEANEIPLLDEVDWSIDYYNGIVFLQDYSSSKVPLYARAFLYVGKMLDEVVTSGSSSSSSSSSTSSGTDDTREKKVYTVTGSHTAGSAFRVANTSFNKAGYRPNMIDVFLNGQLLHSGTSAQVSSDDADYTITSDNQIKLNGDLVTNDLVNAITYLTASSVTGWSAGLPSKVVYAVTGTHTQGIPMKITGVDFSKASYSPNKIHLFLNGQMMTSGSSYDYTLEGSTTGATFSFDLEKNDIITMLLIG